MTMPTRYMTREEVTCERCGTAGRWHYARRLCEGVTWYHVMIVCEGCNENAFGSRWVKQSALREAGIDPDSLPVHRRPADARQGRLL